MKLGLVVAACAILLVGLTGDRAATAHSTCRDISCCSPHGQGSSSTGCWFTDCDHTDPIFWIRTISCPPGSTAALQLCHNSTQDVYGSATADADHTVQTNAGCH
jgi:hypothetical protein